MISKPLASPRRRSRKATSKDSCLKAAKAASTEDTALT